MSHSGRSLWGMVAFVAATVTFSAVTRGSCAVAPAYVHPRVHDELAAQDTTRVIVSLWDSALPEARAKNWRDRVPAVDELVARTMGEVPGFSPDRRYQSYPFLAGRVDRVTLERLAACPIVESIYPDFKVYPTLDKSGPLVGQPGAETQGYTGSGIGVAILDSGIDYTHPDLGAPAVYPNAKIPGGYDFANNDTNPYDSDGHGTHVAGIVAGTGATYRGVAPGAHLLAVKVLEGGGGDWSAVMQGVEWCILHKSDFNIRVINMSLGDGLEWTDPEECAMLPGAEIMRDARDAGILLAVATGNEGYLRGISFPGCVSAATAVGATFDETTSAGAVDTPTDYSNRGELTELYAPGSFITSANLGGGYVTYEGTSMATPHVAGAAAVLAQKGLATPAAIEERLILTGKQIVDPTTRVQTPRIALVNALSGPATTGPDLIVTVVSTAASTVSYGDSVSMTLEVRNNGNAGAGACKAVVALSENAIPSPQDYILATASVPALAAGASQIFNNVTGTVPEIPRGDYRLVGFADSDYAVVEKNEANNGKLGSTVRVGFTAMVVESSIPEFMRKGETYALRITMKNDGDTIWTSGDGFALAATSPDGTTTWGSSRIQLPFGAPVLPGQNVTFSFSVQAPSEPGWYPCHWRMARGDGLFGETATGATRAVVVDDSMYGQDYPSVSGDLVAYEDASGWTGTAISVTNLGTQGTITIPDDVTVPDEEPWWYFDWSYHWYPEVSAPWVTWMVDDAYGEIPDVGGFWYFQVVAYNTATPNELPRHITYQVADAMYPTIDGKRIVWQDHWKEPDGIAFFGVEDPDISIYDLDQGRMYQLCSANDWQLSPRISGDLVVWEDWRDGQADIYLYDLSVDTDGDGIPNWRDSDRPSPDPAEKRLTNTAYWELYPDVDGRTVVWMDLARDIGTMSVIDIKALDLDTMTTKTVALNPATYRDHVRVDGTQVVWEDYRFGAPDVYWSDLMLGVSQPIAGSIGSETVPNIDGQRVVYSKYRSGYGVWNVVAQRMFRHGSVGVHTFADVTSAHWAWDYIEEVAKHGVALGYDGVHYAPSGLVTRDQMATYIARALAGGDASVPAGPGTPTFTDVPALHWAYKYIEYCADPAQDVVGGFGDGSYRPGDAVNRGAMAAFIGRAAAGGEIFFATYTPPATPSFPDVTSTNAWSWHYKYVEYIKSQGIAAGYPDGLYHPENTCTRDQMAVYVSRAFGYTD